MKHSRADGSCALTDAKPLIWFQLFSQGLILVDLVIRYAIRWKACDYVRNGIESATLRFGFDDAFVLISFVSIEHSLRMR